MSEQTMTVDNFYTAVMRQGKLRTTSHAERLTGAVLRALGFNLSGGVKRELARALPVDLGKQLKRGWRLLNVRKRNLSLEDFAASVGLYSGNTDPLYGRMATAAVFSQLKRLIDDDLRHRVAKDLSPEVRELWATA